MDQFWPKTFWFGFWHLCGVVSHGSKECQCYIPTSSFTTTIHGTAICHWRSPNLFTSFFFVNGKLVATYHGFFLVFLLSVCCAVVPRFGKVGIQKTGQNHFLLIYLFSEILVSFHKVGMNLLKGWFSKCWGWQHSFNGKAKKHHLHCSEIDKCIQMLTNRTIGCFFWEKNPLDLVVALYSTTKIQIGALQKIYSVWVFASWFPKFVWLEFRSSYRKKKQYWLVFKHIRQNGNRPQIFGVKIKKTTTTCETTYSIEYHQISTCILTSTPFHQWYSSCKCLAIWVLVATCLHRYRQRWDCRRNPDPTCHVSYEIASTCHRSQGF